MRLNEVPDGAILLAAWEQNPGAMIVIDAGGVIRWVNHALEDVTGHRRDQLIGRSWHILWNETPWNKLSERPTWSGEMRIRRYGGEDIPIRTRIFRVVNDKGEATHCIATQEDVVAGFRRSDQADDGDAFLNLLSEHPSIGWWEYYPREDRLEYGARKMQMLGFPDRPVSTTTEDYLSRLHPHDRSRLETAMLKYVSGEDLELREELRTMTRDGTYRTLLELARIVDRDDEGNPLRIVGISMDISDRVAAEQRLREMEHRFRSIAERTNDGILVLGPDGRVEYASPEYDLQRGMRVGETAGFDVERIYNTIHPDDRDEIFASVYSAIERKRGSLVYEYRARRGDGSYCWYEDNASFVYDREGSHIRSYVVSRNVTDRKTVEHQLRSALRQNELLLREVNHRVKNSLSVVAGLLSIPSAHISCVDEAKEVLQESRNRIYAMAAIYDTLYQNQDLARVDLAGFVATLSGDLKQVYDRRNRVHVSSRIDTIPLSIETSIPIGIILNELITNALRHAFPIDRGLSTDGVDDIPRISVCLNKRGGHGELSVTDNGIGLPTPQQANTTANGDDTSVGAAPLTAPKPGTGRGIEIVEALCSQINATIEYVRSDTGGTGVRIRWPV